MAVCELKQLSKITIEGHDYYLTEIPSDSSQVVVKCTDELRSQLDMQPLVDQLQCLGSFIRVAYASVVGHTNLQVKVRRVYHKVAELCDQSFLAASLFQQSSISALDYLQSTYEYFMEEKFNAGLKSLSYVAKLAEKLENEAGKLENKCKTDAEEVASVENDTIEQQGKINSDKRHCKHIKEKIKIQETKEEKLEKDMQESQQKYDKAEEMYAEQLKWCTEHHESLGLLKTIANTLTSKLLGKEAYGPGEITHKLKQERDRHAELIQLQKQEQQRILEKIAKFAEDLQACDSTGRDLEDTAVVALNQALKTFGHIANTYAAFKIYWSQTKNICLSIFDKQNNLRSQAEDENFKALLENRAFRRSSIQYYGTWIGLSIISKEFMNEIQVIQKQVRNQLVECPTEDEAKATVKDLAKSLQITTRKRIEELKYCDTNEM